jgi:hypothetical protein
MRDVPSFSAFYALAATALGILVAACSAPWSATPPHEQSAISCRQSVSGCPSGAHPAPTPAGLLALVARDAHTLLSRSYSADYHLFSRIKDGSTLIIIHSICTGSADGHCQAVDVFRASGPRPVWHRQYIGVLAMHAVPGGFSVTAPSYAPQDPLCCPTLPAVTDVYTWKGSGLHESGPLPRLPAG